MALLYKLYKIENVYTIVQNGKNKIVRIQNGEDIAYIICMQRIHDSRIYYNKFE